MFKLKSPCNNCPFRRGVGETFRLDAARLEEIRSAVAFQCHKTLDWADDGSSSPGHQPQQCAGLMAVLAREGELNQIMQVATRLSALALDDLDPRGEAYGSWADVLEDHCPS
jgi:hypothetical protein